MLSSTATILKEAPHIYQNIVWSFDQFQFIVNSILSLSGMIYVKGREEYTMIKGVKGPEIFRIKSIYPKTPLPESPVKSRPEGGGVNSGIPMGNTSFTPKCSMLPSGKIVASRKPFLLPFDQQVNNGIGSDIESFQAIQSDALCINIGFDTEFEDDSRNTSGTQDWEKDRRVLSLQASVQIGSTLIRYFFLVDPRYQTVTKDGGRIPMAYMLSDILNDLQQSYFPDLPKIHRNNIPKKSLPRDGYTFKLVDYKAPVIKAITIPITLICHTGKADISVFRRSKYDINLYPKLAEIQGGWCTTEHCYFRAGADPKNDYYWICDLTVRDTLSLTPAENKSLCAIGKVIGHPKVDLPEGAIEHMADFAVHDPCYYYEYAMNDADLVVGFCSSLFGCNRKLPITLSSAAASSMKKYMKQYFGVGNQAEFDLIYRGLMMLDEGIIPSKDDVLKFLKATRYVPINVDSRLFNEFSEEAYTGGFNASFFLGWITDKTTDFDLKNAYPTAMANVVDVDWTKPLRDLPREYYLTRQDVTSPLIPMVAYVDFEFPEDCYCPGIPVPARGLKIYPTTGYNVYACGVDIYLALQMGAKVKCHRGFVAQILEREDGASRSLAYAVSRLVRDRAIAKKTYPDDPLVEKSLKTMVNSCYGKTAQNVSPKTRYNAKKMGRVDAEPSAVTSPYHACYTTALVRAMLIGCINQLHDMGYHVYSVTTDGFITDAPEDVLVGIDAYGFSRIFQEGRYTLNGTRADIKENHVWEAKHYNDTFLNITTRGNVAVNDKGVLAHNSYTTGEVKDSRADRDAYLIAVLSREGRIKCKTKVWTEFAEIVERKHDFHVTEIIRELSMNFDYKRCPIVSTAVDTPVHYEAVNGQIIDTVIAEFDTRPFRDVEEFLNYRDCMKHEDCVKVVKDLKRVKAKSTIVTDGYLGNDPDWTILRSIIMGYRKKIYDIPALDGLKGKDRYALINSWNISEKQFTKDDWTNCGRSSLQAKMLSYEYVKDTLARINEMPVSIDNSETASSITGGNHND